MVEEVAGVGEAGVTGGGVGGADKAALRRHGTRKCVVELREKGMQTESKLRHTTRSQVRYTASPPLLPPVRMMSDAAPIPNRVCRSTITASWMRLPRTG